MYNNSNPNNYDPSQDNLKAQYFNNLVYTYNGIFLNYTEHIDVINYQKIYNFNYYFTITDRTTRTVYNNDTFLCDQQSTINSYMISEFQHYYVPGHYQKLYFYNNQCMLSYPNITNIWPYFIESIIILILSSICFLCFLNCLIIMYDISNQDV